MIDQDSRVGPYKVVKKLGEGTVTTTFQAVHETTELPVVLKVLHAEYAKRDDFSARFFTAARAVNRVDHPGIVRISDFGQLPDGTVYVVMALLAGESVATRLAQNPQAALTFGVAFNVAAQVADTLWAAQEKGLVHWALKSSNVVMVPESRAPGGERVRLLNFGIGKLQHDGAASGNSVRTASLLGASYFYAPEQCVPGGSGGPQSDVYALGVLLFVMLSGRHPFDGPSSAEIMAQHLQELPPGLQSLVPDAPAIAVALVQRALAKNPAERPALHEVRQTLQALSRDHPPPAVLSSPALDVHSRASSPGLIPGDPASALSWLRLALLGLAGALLVGGAVAVLGRTRGVTPAAVPDAAAPRRVRCRIETIPAGATVVLSRTGQALGTTPWETTREAAPEELMVKLQLPGYGERELALDLTADSTRNELLSTAVESPPTASAASPEPAPAESPAKPQKGKGKPASRLPVEPENEQEEPD